MSEFKKYKRSNIVEIREYVEGEVLSPYISISKTDQDHGSPKLGDMIARNSSDYSDQWLVAEKVFKQNYELIDNNK